MFPMPDIEIEGFDGVEDLFAKLMKMPSDVKKDMLEAMGEVAVKKTKEVGERHELRDEDNNTANHILDKIALSKAKITPEGGKIFVTFKGSRKRGNTTTRNAEIAFINEFGTKKIEATEFVREANEACADEAYAAGFKVFNDWLDTI